MTNLGTFKVKDLFDIKMGNKMDKCQMSDGDIPFVGRGLENMGINMMVAPVMQEH